MSPVPTTGAKTSAEQRVWFLVEQFLAELGGERPAGRLNWRASLERDLGLGSLERVELLSRVEAEFGVSLPDSALAEAETVADVLRALGSAQGRPVTEPTVIPSREGPAAAPEQAANLVEALYVHSQANPGRAHVYLRQEDGSEQILTYGQVAARASTAAAELRRLGVGAGDRVALMLPTGEDFLYCFLAVLLAQAVPVPIYPPFRADRIEDYAARQTGILRNAEACLLITVGRGEALARLLRPAVPGLIGVVNAEDLRSESRKAVWPAIPRGGALPALIQYTSGSTGDPKGVLLTHANLLANIRAVGSAMGVRPDDVGVSWLPLYHDMGLIGSWLLCLYFGIPITILSPLAFLSRPERWLWAIHYHRATLAIGPNFAYELCARKIRDESIEGLDLSCCRLALNGSEAVRPETLDHFAARFARYGFRREAFLPVYGLAESTVGLTFPPPGRLPRLDRVRRDVFERGGRAEPGAGGEALTFVSVGRPLTGHEVRIVSEVGEPLGERLQGRLEFRGPSTMAGYFRNPEATAAITRGEWLDSGDLAYWADGELLITGRSKDMILKAGRNLYPQEIEAAVDDVAGVRRGCVAAFGVVDAAQGTEKLVVAAETRELDAAARQHLRAAIGERVLDLLGIPADEVVLLGPGLIPKTSSGKLRRAACRQAFERGALGQARPSVLRQWFGLAWQWLPLHLGQAAVRAARLLYGAYTYALFAPLFLGCWLFVAAARSPAGCANWQRRFLRLFWWLAGFRFEVEGVENLGAGPLVLISNHASYLDPLILIAALPRHLLGVVKKEAFGWPLFGTIVRKVGHLCVDRAMASQSAADMQRIEGALGEGSAVLVFPEGTFTRARGLRPFRLGAFKAAVQTGSPVVPVVIQGSRSVMPDQTWLPRLAPVRILVRPPIQPGGKGWAEIVRLRDAACAEVLAHCGEPRLEIVSAAIPRTASV